MDMESNPITLQTIVDFISSASLTIYIKGGLVILFGYLIARYSSNILNRFMKKRFEAQHATVAQWASFYIIFGLFFATSLDIMGFSISVILGAAGILTVAIGFASQTAASNIISGLFLIGESTFSVGDIIKVGSTVGEVISIDILSVKLRTFDNLMVRIPNETLIKSEVTTLTKFPIRRFDFIVGVAYKEDIKKVQEVLFAIADKNPLCLEEPKPLFIHDGFGDSSVNIKFCVWSARENYLELRNGILIEIKEAFDREGIEIPFPHISLYAGSATTPFPVEANIKNRRDDS